MPLGNERLAWERGQGLVWLLFVSSRFSMQEELADTVEIWSPWIKIVSGT